MSSKDVERANELLERGVSPEEVAREFGFARRSQLVYNLMKAGRRIETTRRIVATCPTEDMSAHSASQVVTAWTP